MTASDFIVKILRLIKTLRNPPLFIYRLFHYLNLFIPKAWAYYIYNQNKKDYLREGVIDYLIDTYDGSGQSVHPDIIYWNNKYWLVTTPYPYGMEEYENPCVYFGDSLFSLTVPNKPLRTQSVHSQGIHLSDPCLAVNGNQLWCYYRESKRKGNLEENIIWRLLYSEINKTWTKEEIVLKSFNDKILSPAVQFNSFGELEMYYISTLNGNHILVSTRSNHNADDVIQHQVYGVPEEYELWHIGISKSIDIYTSRNNENGLMGLFLMRLKSQHGNMKLYETKNDGIETDWHIVQEVQIPNEVINILAFPYKSCFIPKGNGKILLSFRDKLSRNRMIIINNNKFISND